MVKIDDFHIKFDDRWSVYHPGSQVTGSVNLRTNEKIYVDTGIAHFFGQARVLWIQRELKDNQFRNITYNSEKIYFDERIELWRYIERGVEKNVDHVPSTRNEDPIDKELDNLLRSRRGQSLITSGPYLEAGNHEFTFKFQLPSDLPTSFDARGSDGYIRYSIKICLMSQDTIKYSRKAYFSVVKPEDLNLMSPNVRQPVIEETNKLCKANVFGKVDGACYMRLIGKLEKRAYVPGEPIIVNVDVVNQSKKSVKKLKMHLVQNIACHVDQPEVLTKNHSQTLATIGNATKIRSGNKCSLMIGPIFIPAVVPTFAIETIQVNYHVLVEAYRDHDWPKLKMQLPIIVGTVPLNDHAMKSHEASIPLEAPPLYDSIVGIPPPSYEESVSGISGEKEEACIPRYVVYNHW